MENRMQTVIRGASQLKVTRSRRTPGSSAGTGDRWTSRLPGGTIAEATTFGPGDWRSHSPAFTGPGFGRNLDVVAALSRFAADRGATIAQLAVAWVLAHPAVQVAIVGAHPHHLQESAGALDLAPSRDDLAEIDGTMAAAVPLGGPSPEGMT